MKYTLTMAALLLAAACVSPEAHRQVVGAKNALQAQIASMAEAQRTLSAENELLRGQNRDLSARAADATWIAEQKQKLADLLAKYGQGTPSAQRFLSRISPNPRAVMRPGSMPLATR